jgi:hypothetical protein
MTEFKKIKIKKFLFLFNSLTQVYKNKIKIL